MRHNTVAVILIVAAILTAHLASIPPYSWHDNTISELGSQGYKNAWIMRAGFIGFGALVVAGSVQRMRAQKQLWYRELPLVLYGGGILLSGIFSAKPFMPGVDYSELEASLHSTLATLAGVGISMSILLYVFSEAQVRRKFGHLTALVLVVALSALFGVSTTGAGIVQRGLYVVGFGWLIFIETGTIIGQPEA